MIHLSSINRGGVLSVISYLSNDTTNSFLELSSVDNGISFHQPRTFLLALVYAILYPNIPVTVYLHEYSNYNSLNFSLRTLISSLYRFILVRLLCFCPNIQIQPVSRSVARSYGIGFTQYPAYLPGLVDLIRQECNPSCSLKTRRYIVVFLRPFPLSSSVKKLLTNLYTFYYHLDFVFIGTFHETNNSFFESFSQSSFYSYLTRRDLMETLGSCLFFVNTYRKEAYGLTALEAYYSGCIVLSPFLNGVSEWNPPDSFTICTAIQMAQPPPFDLLKTVSLAPP